MTSSEHVYCVAITFKMTEEVQQWICIKFCIKLEHSSVENIQMIQKAPAMGNWWLATLSQQHAHSCTTFVQFVGKTSNPPRWLKPPTAQIWCPVTSGFSQNSTHLWKGRDFRPWMRFRKIWGQLMAIPTNDFQCFEQWKSHWENCVRSQSAYFEGDWGIIILCTKFLVSSSINISMFS